MTYIISGGLEQVDDRKNQNWFLLGFVSDGIGDLFWHRRNYNNNNNNNQTISELNIGVHDVDQLMTSANLFLKQATVTYLILNVGVLPSSPVDVVLVCDSFLVVVLLESTSASVFFS